MGCLASLVRKISLGHVLDASDVVAGNTPDVEVEVEPAWSPMEPRAAERKLGVGQRREINTDPP